MSEPQATKVDPKTGKPARGTRWRIRYRDADRRVRTQTFDRKEDATAALDANKTDIRRNDWIDPKAADRSFNDLAARWWATTVKLAPHTRRGYHVLLEGHVLPYFKGRAQGSIDWLDVEQFIADKLTAGHGAKRVRDMVSIISLIMKMAVRAGLRKDNPAAQHSVPVRSRKLSHGDVLTMEQAHQLVAHTRDPYKPLAWVLVLCGLRPAEACGLQVEHVDFARRILHVCETVNFVHAFDDQPATVHRGPTKTEAGDRFIPLDRSLCDDLAAMLAARAANRGSSIDLDEPLFESIKGGKPLTVDNLRRRIILPALVAAGLPTTIRTYDCRHSHATLLLEDGANVLEVAERMGHDPVVLMRVYGHVRAEAQQGLTDRLERLREAATESPSSAAAVVDLGERRSGSEAG